MLSKEHGVARCDFSTRRIYPDRLSRQTHAHYLRYARQMVSIYRQGVGSTRQTLHQSVQNLFADEDDCPVRRIAAFCKILDDSSTYDRDQRGKAAELRRTVFGMANRFHPLVTQADTLFEQTETKAKDTIAQELGVSWESVERRLFADVPEFQRLKTFDAPEDPVDILSRYNVGQLQVSLYDAVEVRVRIWDDFKTMLRHAKLARLLHTIHRHGDGYEVRLDGPASVLRETRRYGTAFAKFLPALLACGRWQLRATIHRRQIASSLFLSITSGDGYRGLDRDAMYDSSVEANFAESWGTEPRAGWTLRRESLVLHAGQHAYVPDFTLRHESGREVLLEIVGFWTPEYLEAKVRTLERFRAHPMLLAVETSFADKFSAWPGTIRYRKSLSPEAVLTALDITSQAHGSPTMLD